MFLFQLLKDKRSSILLNDAMGTMPDSTCFTFIFILTVACRFANSVTISPKSRVSSYYHLKFSILAVPNFINCLSMFHYFRVLSVIEA